jgi:2'-5' RNA ligase
MSKKRIQLTCFVSEPESQPIEDIRKKFNPLQCNLIQAHVTLCREDELVEIERVMNNLMYLNARSVAVHFGKVTRFFDGQGVYIPAIDNDQAFQELRKSILKGIIEQPRLHEPHITLMHPRNSTCTDSIFEQIEQQHLPSRIVFRKISLIEQEIGEKWRILKEFDLRG